MRLTGGKKRANVTLSTFEYDRRSIVDCVKSGDFDFIGVAITPWHARMAVASYLQLRSSCLIDSGILLIDRHNKDGYLIPPEAVVPSLNVAYLRRGDDGLSSMVQALICRTVLPSLQARKRDGRLVYIANPSFPGSIFDSLDVLMLDCRFSYILLDEGVGSYLSSAEDWARQSIRDRGLRGPSAILRNWLFNYEQRELPKSIQSLKDKGRFAKFYLFEDDGSLNRNNVIFARNSFDLNSNCIDSPNHLINKKYEGAIVFCSQFPLVETGSISLNSHYKAIDAAYQVSKRLGVPFVIKTHPRERDYTLYDRYNSYIDSRHGVALEDILGDLDAPPLCIASLCSTAMIVASAVFNFCGVGLSKLMPEDGISASFVLSCERLNALFGGYYKSPSSVDEFCSYLKEHNNNHLDLYE